MAVTSPYRGVLDLAKQMFRGGHYAAWFPKRDYLHISGAQQGNRTHQLSQTVRRG